VAASHVRHMMAVAEHMMLMHPARLPDGWYAIYSFSKALEEPDSHCLRSLVQTCGCNGVVVCWRCVHALPRPGTDNGTDLRGQSY